MPGVPPLEQFAANLRAERERIGISQETLAERCGMHRTEVSLLERAGREPRLMTVIKLARALEVEPAKLLAGIQ